MTRRWCPDCHGEVYFHHMSSQCDIWYCQGCGKEVDEPKTETKMIEEEVKHAGDD